MPRIVIGDGALYYERQGVGFPVLFVSGLNGFASFWQDQVPAFAKKFDVITHDHRGIGQSDLTRSGFTVDRMAADVIGLMDALEIERAHVVGHSTGGAIAQTLAIEHPKRLASVVLSATWTKPDAYFRRMFGLAQGHPAAAWPQRLCPVQHACSSTRAGGCAKQRSAAAAGGAKPRRVSADRGRRQPDRRDAGLRPYRGSWRASRRRPWWSAPRTIW